MISIEDLHVRYGDKSQAVLGVRGVSLAVEEGQFFTLLGPSGCGKTTTIRCIAGLETPCTGNIHIDGETVFASAAGISVPTYKRNIGVVFQSYAIWPHMTVYENVAFPLQELRKAPSRKEIRQRVETALELVQLGDYIDRPAPNLSGGQQQRLALARALVREPRVLLLDEPLSNLDAKLRESMRADLRELVKRLGMTAVYVTHDQTEALTMSDRIAVMESGAIVQEGTPAEIYNQPKNSFVARFIGVATLLEGRAVTGAAPGARIEVDVGGAGLAAIAGETLASGDRVSIMMRPENIVLGASPTGQANNVLQGTVTARHFAGDCIELRINLQGQPLEMRVHPSTNVSEGDHVYCEIEPENCRVLSL